MSVHFSRYILSFFFFPPWCKLSLRLYAVHSLACVDEVSLWLQLIISGSKFWGLYSKVVSHYQQNPTDQNHILYLLAIFHQEMGHYLWLKLGDIWALINEGCARACVLVVTKLHFSDHWSWLKQWITSIQQLRHLQWVSMLFFGCSWFIQLSRVPTSIIDCIEQLHDALITTRDNTLSS